jgi:hypothetical protein
MYLRKLKKSVAIIRLFETKFTFERRTMYDLYKNSVPTAHYGTLSSMIKKKTNHLICIMYKVKEQQSLVKIWTGPESSRRLRLPD